MYLEIFTQKKKFLLEMGTKREFSLGGTEG